MIRASGETLTVLLRDYRQVTLTKHMAPETVEEGVVDVQGELVRFEVRIVDARSRQQRTQDAQRGKPAGNLMVVVPGHGQSIHGPKKLVATAAQLSKSKIAWCIDAVPTTKGDRLEAQALAHAVRERIQATFPHGDGPISATLIGWSHGGSEALLAAEHDPDLFPQYLGLCPTGFADRQPLDLLRSFFLEAAQILWSSVRRGDWTCLTVTLRVGWNAGAGLLRDLWRSRSPRRLTEDIDWATRSVVKWPLAYSGEVVVLFGAQDTVVRWQDAFPSCERALDVATSLAEFREKSFPQAKNVEVRVLKGAHVAPEVDAFAYLRTGLSLLQQLDRSALENHERENLP